MALLEDAGLLRTVSTYILPSAIVTDFCSGHDSISSDFHAGLYEAGTEDAIYEKRDVLRTRVLHWVRESRFSSFAIIESPNEDEITVDASGVHVRVGILQPNMLTTLSVAPVSRSFDKSTPRGLAERVV